MIAEYEQRLRTLVKIFLEENSKINLSALRTEEDCWIGNILDSLAAEELIEKDTKIIDVGTGGGFPLLPLAICHPDSSFTGLDATKKKTESIKKFIQELGLKNVEIINARCEDIGRDRRHREQYDLALARAVAPVNVLLEYCSPFVKVGGRIILWKSLSIEAELAESTKAQQELRCKLLKTHRYTLPGDRGERQLLIFQKTGPLSKEYPRAVGTPKKHPVR